MRDVLYGYGVEIEQSGNDVFAHKTAFLPKSLTKLLNECGFPVIYVNLGNIEIEAFALKERPSDYIGDLFNLHTVYFDASIRVCS